VKRTIGIAALALAALTLPLPTAPATERLYSSGIYPHLQALLTGISNHVGIAFLDLLMVAALVSWSVFALDDFRRCRVRGLIPIVRRTVEWLALGYLVFLACWGLNYRREPVTTKVGIDTANVTAATARALALQIVERLNALAADAHRMGWHETSDIDPDLAAALERTMTSLGYAAPVVARPKRTILDMYFRRVGVDGMTDPYFLETFVVSDLLPFERPMVIAHEWSHLAGIANEGEANFAGWLTAIHGSAADEYSGWLFLYGELGIPVATLNPQSRQDLTAIRMRIAHNVAPRVSAVAWQAYDSYLKSNRVTAGAASYREVVQLVLGARFDAHWNPVIASSGTSRASPR